MNCSFSCAFLKAPGITCASVSESRQMYLPMSVMPVAAVLETPITGTCACCASGSAALAVFESVGPRMAETLSRLMNFWKTVMPCSLVEASSSMRTSSGAELPRSASAAWMPARC